jgi:hypothetical protein
MLPEALTIYFADSEVKVLDWNADGQALTLSVDKEIGPESGELTFTGVTYMALSSALTAESISVLPPAEAERMLPNPGMAADGVVYAILDIEGVINIIVAQLCLTEQNRHMILGWAKDVAGTSLAVAVPLGKAVRRQQTHRMIPLIRHAFVRGHETCRRSEVPGGDMAPPPT